MPKKKKGPTDRRDRFTWHRGDLVIVKPGKKRQPELTVSQLGKLGNIARNKNLTPEQRSEIARKAGRARWKGLTAKERRELAARGGAASKGTPKSKPKPKRRKPR